jgi:hypothetical protein
MRRYIYPPKEGDKRTVRRFLLLPMTLKVANMSGIDFYEQRWLEWAWIEQEYVQIYDEFCSMTWRSRRWTEEPVTCNAG